MRRHLGWPAWFQARGAHHHRNSARGDFRVDWWNRGQWRKVANWAAAELQASLTATSIIGWATAEWVGTDSGAGHDRMSVGAVEALK